IQVMPSIGFGRYSPHRSIPLPHGIALTEHQIKTTQLTDISGDGLADIVTGPLPGNQLMLSINQGGFSFDKWVYISDLPVPRSSDYIIRWADMNGNGSSDLVLLDSTAAAPIQIADIAEAMGAVPRRYLLSNVNNGRGHDLLITYKNTTDYLTSDLHNGRNWKETLPFSFPVVAKTEITTDSTAGVQLTEYHYHEGVYAFNLHEFQGFNEVDAVELGDITFPSLITRSFFHSGRRYEGLKGKLWKIVLEDEKGKVFETTETRWSEPPMPIREGITFTHPTAVIKTIIERGNGNEKQLVQEFGYDKYGNRIYYFDQGIVSGNADKNEIEDEQIIRTDYAIDKDRWLLCFPSRQRLYDGNEKLVSRSDMFYDDETFSGKNYGKIKAGNLTLTRKWIVPVEPDYDDNSGSELFINTDKQRYDNFGNVIQILDPLAVTDEDISAVDDDGHFETVQYDDLFHIYPVTETIHLGNNKSLNFHSEYDYRFGDMKLFKSPTDTITHYKYDPLGRLTEIHRPDDPDGFPSVVYDYQLGQPDGKGRRINWIETRLRDRNPTEGLDKIDHYFVSRRFLDGAGRSLLTKQEAEPDPQNNLPRAVLVGAVAYNTRGRATEFLVPCFSRHNEANISKRLAWEDATDSDWKGIFTTRGQENELGWETAPKTHRLFDPLGREIAVINPDQSMRTVEFKPLAKTLKDENISGGKNGVSLTYYFDGMNRLIQVDEHPYLKHDGTVSEIPAQWATRYRYDKLGNLTKIIDSVGNQKSFIYDRLNRIIEIDDPNYGQRLFEYDTASNLICVTDAMKLQTRYSYDGANRLIREYFLDEHGKNSDHDIIYEYDRTLNGQGRLGRVKDQTGISEFNYDKRGRQIKISRNIEELNNPPLATVYEYDAFDRLSSLTYPDGDRSEYHYNERNLPKSICLDSVGMIVVDMHYNADEQKASISFGNGVLTSFNYDIHSRLKQVKSIKSGQEQSVFTDLFYDYDLASNLIDIKDNRLYQNWTQSHTQKFQYDGLYRLTEVIYPSQKNEDDQWIRYRYDPIGNLISQHSNVAMHDLGILRYGNKQLCHAVLEIGKERKIDYDANGRVISFDNANLEWNQRDRLTLYNNSDFKARYGYDYDGMRVIKDVRKKHSNQKEKSQITVYVSPEYEIRSDVSKKNISIGGTRVALVKSELSENLVPRAPPTVEFIHTDHLGSPIVVTDSEGNTINEHTYYPFGELRYHKVQISNRGFIGTEYDTESGLLAFEARYMWGTTGRYLSPDPELLLLTDPPLSPQSLNLYAYSANRPLTHIDPDGRLFSFVITAGFAAYDTYQYSVGNISGLEYTGAMALNGAALVADLSTGGMGGGIAVRAGNAVIKAARVVTRADSAYSAGNAAVHAAIEINKGNYGRAAMMAGFGVLAYSKSADDFVNLASSQRTKHILTGDATGGGHKFGLTRLFNGKTKFPALWSDKKIMNAVSEVATNPNSQWIQKTGPAGAQFTHSGQHVKYAVEGVYEGTKIRVIVQGSDIITAFPIK
ncbi:MAG: EndoU domain-containing protein, partial [Desulfamplus sp.]|nr:EndoU domain-containing protein [Desulfamplus sp.]